MKRRFVELRGQGLSFASICEQLHISKSTCTAWSRELAGQIEDYQRQELRELAESYGIAKGERIKRLGSTLAKITATLQAADFTEADPVRLLDHQLKYSEALKDEYIGLQPAPALGGNSGAEITQALKDLLQRVRAGEVSTEQAQREASVLSQLLKAYEITELKDRVEDLAAIIGGK